MMAVPVQQRFQSPEGGSTLRLFTGTVNDKPRPDRQACSSLVQADGFGMKQWLPKEVRA